MGRAFKYAIFLLLMTFIEAYRVRTGEQTLVLTKAKTSIQASELLSRPPLSARSGQIPKFFHQSWTSPQLAAEPNELSPSCRRMHWDWEWVYWTERDVLDLIRMYFPWFEGIYSIISNERHRANVAKYLYINVYGGVHADANSTCTKTPNELEKDHNLSFGLHNLGRSPATAVLSRATDDSVPKTSLSTAWIASSPGHPLLSLIVRHLPSRVDDVVGFEAFEDDTALTKALARYSKVYPGHLSGDTHRGSARLVSDNKHQVVLLPADEYILARSDEAPGEL